MGKKAVVMFQLFIGLVILIASVGMVVFSVREASQSFGYFSGIAQSNTTNAEEFQTAFTGLMTQGITGLVFGIASLFGAILALISLFMILDAIYKWPSEKGNINYSK